MAIHTITGCPRRRDDILDEFFEDVSGRLGWRRLGQVMHLVQVMEQAPTYFYVIGSRALGCHRKDSDLDILADRFSSLREFERQGIVLDPSWNKPITDQYRKTLKVSTESCYGDMYRVRRLRDESLSLDFQLMWRLRFRKDLWETIQLRHLEAMRGFAALPKEERRAQQARLFIELGDSASYWRGCLRRA